MYTEFHRAIDIIMLHGSVELTWNGGVTIEYTLRDMDRRIKGALESGLLTIEP